MKLLKLKTNTGFMMLEPGFEVNFLTKTRVDRNSDNDELLELEEGFYYPIDTILIGKTSSGKTTVLRFIECALSLLTSGRIYKSLLPYSEKLNLEIVFYEGGKVYHYNGSFSKNSYDMSEYLMIDEESLECASYKRSLKKDLSNIAYSKVGPFVAKKLPDTSDITNYVSAKDFVGLEGKENYFVDSLLKASMIYPEETISSIIHIFDDSVASIRINKDNHISFKRVNEPELMVTATDLKEFLSSGAYRGIALLCQIVVALKYGSTLLIDDIEKHFNKNLTENTLLLFRDKEINKAGATLIYTTNYSELLDMSSRSDNINVLHKVDKKISIKNLCVDYKDRIELSKSNKYDQNAFDTSITYKSLITLRRNLLK